MAKLLLFVISAVLIAVQAEVFPPQPPPPPQNSTSTSTTSTTQAPITTSTKPTSTTKTTPAPVPPKPTPSPTPKPTPSPTPKPEPAPEPPKPSDPQQGTWHYTETTSTSNVTCIKIQFALQIVVPYFHKSRNKTYNATVNVPTNAVVADAACGNETEHLKLQWMNKDNATDTVLFKFANNATAKEYELQSIEINLYPDDDAFPGIENKNVIRLNHDHSEFVTGESNSYKCEKEQKLNLTDAGKETGFAGISHLQVQAFGTTNSDAFKSAIDCDASSTPDVVPIAVGCALAILVIVVLVAYLIGRKRRQARGYLSM
ncbi:hypothetical protein PPYR_08914 [Photinus pyralis]|uniref:Lysosome-associated membrane glycoprotein 5 n=1 Tax=Photinus pyralis TaxID=7054 RepID=A0A1Y1L5P3_PHOPY|nr:lysosome-associated membrane glycoprotein 1-like [Photinus pyralis]KAB0797921.1 hypothetical protein PPYR_08914 [Photinus pyralis]